MKSVLLFTTLFALCAACSNDTDIKQTFKSCPDSNHPHAIDLGLPSGTKWACCNVDAKIPEGYGGYYAWGETSEKSLYSWRTYAYGTGYENCTDIGKDIAGTNYDVAHVRMGGAWRMPNHIQQVELRDFCTRQWTTINGVRGILLIGPNGGHIFLPAAGAQYAGDWNLSGDYGSYWSSSLDQNDNGTAYDLNFGSNDGGVWGDSDEALYVGNVVRAVCP